MYTKLSRFLCYVLRHKPEVIGISIDEYGWTDVNVLIKNINNKTIYNINMDILSEIVKTDDKQRYSFNNNKSKIKANQGHSLPIKIKYNTATPPELLYHGTSTGKLDAIYKSGIEPMGRQYVHLTEDSGYAYKAGQRYGTPVIIAVNSKQMHNDGIPFYLADNGVWLTDFIDKKYLMSKKEK